MGGGESNHVTFTLVVSTLMAVVGSTFQFGYNTGVINAPEVIIKSFFNETMKNRTGEYFTESTLTLYWGFAVSMFAIGGMIGSLCAGVLAGKLGLKYSFLVNNFVAIPAALLMGFSKQAGSFEMLIVGRLLIGINSGINMGIAPMYLTEIAPVEYRGVFGVFTQLGVVSSILLSQLLGLSQAMGTEECWPYLLAFTGIFSIVQIALIAFCPESPRFLYLTRDRADLAEQALRSLRGSDADLDEELSGMKQEMNANPGKAINLSELFSQTRYRWPLAIAAVMQLSQQLSGINAVFYYSTGLFKDAGVPNPDLATVGVGVVNVVMTLVSLSLIERAGRKLLHLIGLGGMFTCAVLITILMTVKLEIPWPRLIPILAFVVFFQVGPGAIPWFITAELFNQQSRPTAVAVAGVVNWLGNFSVGLLFPIMKDQLGGYAFLIFASLLAVFWIFTFFKVPETKGKDINQITAIFESSSNEASKEALIVKAQIK